MRKFEIAKGFENEDVSLPTRATSKSAGYDLKSLETYVLKPGERHTFPTGLKACMEGDEVLYIFVRSSMAIKKGVRLSNSVGVIDADYYSNVDNDGHIMVSLFNFSDKEVEIVKGDRIAQGIFMKYLVVDDDMAAGTRTGGFGSTNK